MTIEYRTINTRYINTITHTDNKNHETCHTDLNRYPIWMTLLINGLCRMRSLFDIWMTCPYLR